MECNTVSLEPGLQQCLDTTITHLLPVGTGGRAALIPSVIGCSGIIIRNMRAYMYGMGSHSLWIWLCSDLLHSRHSHTQAPLTVSVNLAIPFQIPMCARACLLRVCCVFAVARVSCPLPFRVIRRVYLSALRFHCRLSSSSSCSCHRCVRAVISPPQLLPASS